MPESFKPSETEHEFRASTIDYLLPEPIGSFTEQLDAALAIARERERFGENTGVNSLTNSVKLHHWFDAVQVALAEGGEASTKVLPELLAEMATVETSELLQ